MDSSACMSLATQIEQELRSNVLSCWFPRCIDVTDGGFHQNFTQEWTRQSDSTKSHVFQARMTWVLATMARERADLRGSYSRWASHGFEFLSKRAWDPEYGGFFFFIDGSGEKHSYAMSFGIFAAAACYRNDGSKEARGLALRAFEWWEERCRDREHGGYFEALDRGGKPIQVSSRPRDLISVPYGLRSSNTHIHVIEALTELLRAAPDDQRVRTRLAEGVSTLEDTVSRHGGRLYTTYTRNWRPVNRTVSYGHDVEAAYLCLDARDVLGWELRSPTERLLERALERGLDHKHGGLFFGRKPLRPYPRGQKEGWPQCEALNAFSYMHERTGCADSVYLDAFLNVWRFVITHIVDRRHHGCFGSLDRDGTVRDRRKGHAWKACYHAARALLNSADVFRRLGTRVA